MKFLGHRGAADHVAALDHLHLQARHRQIGRAGQAVVAGADDQHVGFVMAASVMQCQFRVLEATGPVIARRAVSDALRRPHDVSA